MPRGDRGGRSLGSGVRCVAANCGNTRVNGVSLHMFPKDPSMRRLWKKFVDLKRVWKGPTQWSALCSAHFTEDCFPFQYKFKREQMGQGSVVKCHLNKDAVPTIQTASLPLGKFNSPPKKIRKAFRKRELARIIDEYTSKTEEKKVNLDEQTKSKVKSEPTWTWSSDPAGSAPEEEGTNTGGEPLAITCSTDLYSKAVSVAMHDHVGPPSQITEKPSEHSLEVKSEPTWTWSSDPAGSAPEEEGTNTGDEPLAITCSTDLYSKGVSVAMHDHVGPPSQIMETPFEHSLEKMATEVDSNMMYKFDLDLDLDSIIQSTIKDLCSPEKRETEEWNEKVTKIQPVVKLCERRQKEINRLLNDCQKQLDNFKSNLEDNERAEEKVLKEAEKAFTEAAKYPSKITIEESEEEDDDVQFIQETYDPGKSSSTQSPTHTPTPDVKPDIKPTLIQQDSIKTQTREKLKAALHNAGAQPGQQTNVHVMRKFLTASLDRQAHTVISPPTIKTNFITPTSTKQQPVATTIITVPAAPTPGTSSSSSIAATNSATIAALQQRKPATAWNHYSTSIANQEKMERLYLADVNNIRVGDQVLYKKVQDLWDKGILMEVHGGNKPAAERKYKVRYDMKKNLKLLNSRQIAFSWSITKPVTVGTRIVALYKEDDSDGAFYAGIVAEAPNGRNDLRYLVFFDDGYAQYCTSSEIYKVFYQSKPVWEDIHPDSQDFVRDYLAQYPERPMVRLHKGQSVKTEWNGKWWNAKVEAVDASLVSMYFAADHRSEWIYRGSTRLEPLYTALANAEANRNAGKVKRQTMAGAGPKKPVVEYTRNNSTDTPPKVEKSVEKVEKKKAVAKKSTTPGSVLNIGKIWETSWMKKKIPDVKPSLATPSTDKYSTTTISSKPSKDTKDIASVLQERLVPPEDAAADLEALGTRLNKMVPMKNKEMKKYSKHKCNTKCMAEVGEDPDKFKGNNPLLIPLFMGWERHVSKLKPSGRRVIFYQSPCGRRLRTIEELDVYLQITDCSLAIDNFCYDTELHVNYEFIPVKTFCDIKDISYGKEHVAISCVNGIDRQYPDYVDYSNQRIPSTGVKLNVDPEFLVCCDCTDNCRDKSKCACQQLTVETSAIINGGKPDPEAGFINRRLPEPIISGVYECNSRCGCDRRCVNRVAQNGLHNRLQVFKTEKRGWGLRCLDDIPRGGFICIYAGQLLTDHGANEDGQQYGDEYLAELDYMEVVERHKDGYESDVEDIDGGSDNEEFEEEEDSHDDGMESDDSFGKGEKVRIRNFEEKSHQTRSTGSKKSKQTAQKSSTLPPKSKSSGSVEEEGEELPELEDPVISSPNDDQKDGETKKKRTGRSTAARFGSIVPSKKEKDGNESEEIKFMPTRDYFNDKENQSCYIMDAKSMGNIGRYLNHSCQPCAFVQNVFVDTHDLRFPWIAFFAGQYISAGTELTWDYNYEVGSVPGKVLYCYCGSAECRGRLL